jgi:hypothetical protein
MDVPFFKDGRLGAPIPTFEHLSLPAQFGDPKPIELQKLLDATKLFKIAIGNSETSKQAITAAEQFCNKIGEPFIALGIVDPSFRTIV